MRILRNLCFAALALSGVTAVQAQTWSFDATEWGISCGTADIDGSANTIKSTGYQWGCLGIKYTGTKTVNTAAHNLVITGKNLQKGTSNPNIDKFCIGSDSMSVLSSRQAVTSVNDKNTLIVFNVSSLLTAGSASSYEADGTIQIRYMNFYLQEAKINDLDVSLTVDNVQFLTDAQLTALQDSLNNIVTNEYSWNATKWSGGDFGTVIQDASTNSLNIDSYDATNGASIYFGDNTGTKDFTVSSGNTYLYIKGSNLGETTLDYMNIGGSEAFSDPITGTLSADSTSAAINLGDVFEAAKDNIVEGMLHFRELTLRTLAPTNGTKGRITSISFITPTLYNKYVADENAQDFTFKAPEWKQTCGTIEIDTAANKITATSYNWGCVGVEFNGASLISSEKPYIVVKGKYLVPGSSNPNIYQVNLNETKTSASGLRMTVNSDSTIIYYNLGTLLNANDTLKRADNKFVLNKIGMYLQLPKNANGDSLHIAINDVKFASYSELQQMLNIKDADDFTFKAPDWKGTCGTVAVDTLNNKITASAYQWGCAGILNKDVTYSITPDKPYLVIEGTNLQQGVHNPCVYTFSIAGTDMLGGAKPLMKSIKDSTVCIVDMSSYIQKAVDMSLLSNGKLQLTSMGFYLQEAKDASATDINLTVTNIKFISQNDYDVITAIKSVNAENDANGKVYNINGQLMKTNTNSLEGLHKGIYIINGKKYIKI